MAHSFPVRTRIVPLWKKTQLDATFAILLCEFMICDNSAGCFLKMSGSEQSLSLWMCIPQQRGVDRFKKTNLEVLLHMTAMFLSTFMLPKGANSHPFLARSCIDTVKGQTLHWGLRFAFPHSFLRCRNTLSQVKPIWGYLLEALQIALCISLNIVSLSYPEVSIRVTFETPFSLFSYFPFYTSRLTL